MSRMHVDVYLIMSLKKSKLKKKKKKKERKKKTTQMSSRIRAGKLPSPDFLDKRGIVTSGVQAS